ARASCDDLCDDDPDRVRRRGRAIRVGTAVAKQQAMRPLDLENVKVAVILLAGGPGHLVLDATAGRQIVFGEARWVRRRPPPALELARLRPQLPDALDRCIAFGLHGPGDPLGRRADSGYG